MSLLVALILLSLPENKSDVTKCFVSYCLVVYFYIFYSTVSLSIVYENVPYRGWNLSTRQGDIKPTRTLSLVSSPTYDSDDKHGRK